MAQTGGIAGDEGTDGDRIDGEDPLWNDYRGFMAAAPKDPAVLLPRLLLGLVVKGRLDELGAKVRPDRGPSRAELLEAVGA